MHFKGAIIIVTWQFYVIPYHAYGFHKWSYHYLSQRIVSQYNYGPLIMVQPCMDYLQSSILIIKELPGEEHFTPASSP